MPLAAKQRASLSPHASASRRRGRGGPAAGTRETGLFYLRGSAVTVSLQCLLGFSERRAPLCAPGARLPQKCTGLVVVVTAAAAGSSPQLEGRCRRHRRRSRGNKAPPSPPPFCGAEAQAGEVARPPSAASRRPPAPSAAAQALIGREDTPSLGACC